MPTKKGQIEPDVSRGGHAPLRDLVTSMRARGQWSAFSEAAFHGLAMFDSGSSLRGGCVEPPWVRDLRVASSVPGAGQFGLSAACLLSALGTS